MYLSDFWKFLTFSIRSNQLVHQKSTNQPKTNKTENKQTENWQRIQDFQCKYWKCNKIFLMQRVEGTHNVFGLRLTDLCSADLACSWNKVLLKQCRLHT